MATMADPGKHEPGDTVLYFNDDGRLTRGTVAAVRRIYSVVPDGTVGIVDNDVAEA